MSSTYLFFFIEIGVGYVFSYLIMRGLARLSQRSRFLFRVILFPGIVLHELSHLLASFVTGTPVEEIAFWTETGGHVIHHKPKYGFITQPIISLAPFPIGIAALLFLGHFLSIDHLLISAIVLFLMLSIAATLAPSKTDISHAIEGIIVMAGVIVAFAVFYPDALIPLNEPIATFNAAMLIVNTVLLGFWLGLYFLRATAHRLARR